MSYRTLKNSAKRELANGFAKDPIYKLRLICFAKGASGILDLAKSIRKMDENGSLSLDKFVEGIRKSGLDCNEDELITLFYSFYVSEDGCINTNEFLNKLRPPMTLSRINIINRAFEKIDSKNDGVITFEDLKNVYCARNHPKYLSGDLTEKEIVEHFLNNFSGERGGKKKGGKVTKEDFFNYYATLSASIHNHAYFKWVMKLSYNLDWVF